MVPGSTMRVQHDPKKVVTPAPGWSHHPGNLRRAGASLVVTRDLHKIQHRQIQGRHCTATDFSNPEVLVNPAN